MSGSGNKPVRFVSTITRKGEDGYYIRIPNTELERLKHLWKHKVKVTVEEIAL